MSKDIISGANINKAGVYPGWKMMAKSDHDKITVEALTVTENDTYTAPAGKAYSPVTVNVEGGGGQEFLELHISFTMPELPAGENSLKMQIPMTEKDGEKISLTDGYSFVPVIITESVEDFVAYNVKTLMDVTVPPAPPEYTAEKAFPFWIEGTNGTGPYFDPENSTFTGCHWNNDKWVILIDGDATSCSIAVAFTDVSPY